ncbi:MAG: hypothetical protein GY853_09710 [PVC group bacterium]|nr:hypothetical protein [PVC group bacterium]
MKNRYYNIISEEKLPEVFVEITELSYTKKIEIILELLTKYDSTVVSNSLQEYKREYIDLKRVNIGRIKNQLMYLCKKFEKEIA